MATRVIDINDSAARRTTSPISVGLWFVYFIFLNIFIKDDFIILILLSLVGWVVFDILFKFTPRLVFITIEFIFEAQSLTPSFEDKLYYKEFYKLKELDSVFDFSEDKKRDNKMKKRIGDNKNG